MADEPPSERVARGLEQVEPQPSIVTIGMFDGVHRGHQTIIGRAVREAAERDLRSVAVTFDRHPREVVRPGSQPAYLQTLEQKIAALLAEGLDLVVVLPFDLELSEHPPDAFVQEVLDGPIQARKIIVGANFRFGHKAAGDVVALTDLGARYGFATEAVTLLNLDDTPISSTEIRDRLAAGDVAWAAEALGRPHVVEGPVVRGEGRGRSIGIPTANIEVAARMAIPAIGVYVATARADGDRESHDAVVNIGVRPTFGGEHMTVEAHLLDAELDLYGRHLAVGFLERLRDERRFGEVDELVEQIHRDIERARDLLG